MHFDEFTNAYSTTFFSASLWLIGDLEEATMFGYYIEVMGTSRNLSSRGFVGSIRENSRMVFPRDGCEIIIPLNSLLFILEANDNFDNLEIKGHIDQIY